MAYTTINKHTAHFNTITYTGDQTTKTITGVGFQPDMVWGKGRNSSSSHSVVDAVRGATKSIFPDTTAVEDTNSTSYLTAFTSDGYSVNSASNFNVNSRTQVNWNWKANGAGSSNSDGNGITSTVSANTTSGFSIVKYTGTGNAAHTIGHGLGVKPACVIMRPLGYSGAWWIAHKDLSTDNVLEFNTNAQAAISGFGGGGLKYSTFTTSVIGGGNGSSNSELWNKSGEDYIAYCFAEKTGYSKFGSYTGNGTSADGTFIYLGFKPAFFICKKSSGTSGWMLFDNTRRTFNMNQTWLYPNTNDAESTSSTLGMDFLSNGVKHYNQWGDANQSGDTYIYMAFGQTMVGTNNVPATAR